MEPLKQQPLLSPPQYLFTKAMWVSSGDENLNIPWLMVFGLLHPRDTSFVSGRGGSSLLAVSASQREYTVFPLDLNMFSGYAILYYSI